MKEYLNVYENLDNIDPVELLRAGGVKDPETITWPKGKKFKIQLAGKECSVTTSFRQLEERVDGDLDAYAALSTMMSRDEVVEMMWKKDPNGGTDAINYAHAEFLPGLPELTDDEREQRKLFAAAILTLLSDQKTIEVLAECAPRKKNGLFQKGRVFKVGLTGFAYSFDSELVAIVGRSKDETKLTISIEERHTSPDEKDDWEKDFISTYHEGLPISEALKTILGETKQRPTGRKIKPDLFKGFGDGVREIDESVFDEDPNYASGIDEELLNEANSLLEIITKWIVDPDSITWDGKYVNIKESYGKIHESYIKKIMEAGAIPLSTRWNRKIEKIDIVSLDYSSWRKRNIETDSKQYISKLKTLANRLEEDANAGKATHIITEKAFQRWCVNGQASKLSLENNEHLERYKSDKIVFDKLENKDVEFLIKAAIEQHAKGKKKAAEADLEDYKGLCCVGSGLDADKACNIINSTMLNSYDEYKETAEWPYLILSDSSSEECLHAFCISRFNKDCGVKVKVIEASEFVSKMEGYEGFIHEEGSKYENGEYDFSELIKVVQKRMEDNNEPGFCSMDTQRERVESQIEHFDALDFEGKNFVLERFNMGVYSNHILGKGGLIKDKVNGKTNYLVVDPNDSSSMIGALGRDALKQIEKGKPIKIITIDNLKEILQITW